MKKISILKGELSRLENIIENYIENKDLVMIGLGHIEKIRNLIIDESEEESKYEIMQRLSREAGKEISDYYSKPKIEKLDRDTRNFWDIVMQLNKVIELLNNKGDL